MELITLELKLPSKAYELWTSDFISDVVAKYAAKTKEMMCVGRFDGPGEIVLSRNHPMFVIKDVRIENDKFVADIDPVMTTVIKNFFETFTPKMIKDHYHLTCAIIHTSDVDKLDLNKLDLIDFYINKNNEVKNRE